LGFQWALTLAFLPTTRRPGSRELWSRAAAEGTVVGCVGQLGDRTKEAWRCMGKKQRLKKEKRLQKLGKSLPPGASKPVCGLCGKSARVTTTECCGRPICDDEDSYQVFSFARNSCSRNHRRLTLCGTHFIEGHDGDWRTCLDCKDDIETELYVYYGTNEFNFEKLLNPPSFSPKKCSECGRVIRLGAEGHSLSGDDYFCEECTSREFRL
jgi:hypothetical protein